MAHRDMAWVVKGKLAQLLGNAGLSRVGRFRSLVRDRMRPPRHAELVAHRLARPTSNRLFGAKSCQKRHPQGTDWEKV